MEKDDFARLRELREQNEPAYEPDQRVGSRDQV